MNISIICSVLILCAAAKAFPAEGDKVKKSIRTNSEDISGSTFKQSQPFNASSISTTSSLLFKDKKPILTYLLGQPKNQGSVSSPAQLLSPDRYEFFTFDDDGQIVKKLMSVKEIQKIIANNEKGASGEHNNPVEYYQILTVTPDVESIPSVSRINPNEPLFSIHDVIASVQNVLKSEIKIKQSQSAPKLNVTNFLASASSDHIEILTETPEVPAKIENQKITAATVQQPVTTAAPNTNKPEAHSDVKVTTYRPVDKIHSIFQDANFGTHKPILVQEPAITPKPLVFVSSSATSKPLPLSASSTTQKPITATASETPKPQPPTASPPNVKVEFVPASSPKPIPSSTAAASVTEAAPLSLKDAHPALISNESFLDQKPFTVEQVSRIAEFVEELKTASSSNPGFIKVETVERTQIPVDQSAKPVTAPTPDTSTAKVEITPDLADSVSSVLWQIASENSMFDSVTRPTESSVGAVEAKDPEFIQIAESVNPGVPGTSAPTVSITEVPAQSRSTVKIEKHSGNPLIALQNILRTQNRPRPFQKLPVIEKGTPEPVESRTEEFVSSTTPAYERIASPSSTVVILTAPEETSPEPEKESIKVDANKDNATQEFASTTAGPALIISVSPDAVVQSPEHVKPAVTANVSTTTPAVQNQTIEVQVIQEANIGQIPRTTEYPGQIVKEIQRMETPLTEFTVTEESLTDSASINTFSTHLPYSTASETTTVSDVIQGKTEIPVESETDNEESTTFTLDLSDAKSEEPKETSSSDRLDITYVPMMIKTPTEFKKQETPKPESQPEEKEEVATTLTTVEEEVVTEQDETTQAYITETTVQEEAAESKELPEAHGELKTNVPQTTTEATQKATALADDLSSETDFTQLASLKQNVKPLYTKPSKPVYVKPVKGKPQTDAKTPKPAATIKPLVRDPETKKPYENHLQSSPSVLELEAAPDENLGLEATVANLDGDIKRFTDLCNELAFSLWTSVTHNGLSFVRSIVISPFAVTSLLAMVFLGARGPTSGQMNDVLKLDEMVTFNPHLVFRNVTESLVISRNPGVATAAFVRELYSDKSKGKLLDFYKERVQQFYDGHVEEVNFKTLGDTLRRQTNHLVKRQTWGKITDFLRGSNLMPRPPLAAFSANIFQTDCTRASTKDRDGEMYFVILPSSRLRRLVPIPAVVWREGFLAGYEPNLDATAVSINPSDSAISTIFVLPGQQGLIAPGDTLARLEHHLLGSSYKKGHWSRLMRSLLPRPGLELQIPRMSHKSVINVTTSLQRMGLKDLFSADKADLTGLNGLANDLHLSDMLQVNLFSTCGEEPIGSRHHSEIYPATPILRREKSSDNMFSDSLDNLFAVSDFEDPAIAALPLELRPRQARVPLSKPGARIPEPPRLRFDRPFLFFVRHNPTGLILHMGRFNPRLMP